MRSPKIFQIVLIGMFVVFLGIGMLAFSGHLPTPKDSKDINYGEVTMWGVLPSSVMDPLLSSTGPIRNEKIVIKYVEKKKETLDQEFIEALASGNGPDLIVLPHYSIAKNIDKLTIIPFESVTENYFKNTFLEEGELFLRSAGIAAIPFTIDPIVMYWNRDIFTNLSVVTPPTKWKDFYALAPRVTVRDTSGNIKQSFVAFGEYANINNAKDILSLLILQSGSKIVEGNEDYIYSTIGRSSSSDVPPPAMGAVRFFMEFSKPEKDSYSWNRTLPNSRRMFEAGNLALYFGYASEYVPIAQKNPHLNFSVAVVPQAEQTTVKSTFGKMDGLAVVKAGKNQSGALYAALLLSRADVQQELAGKVKLPPVRRDLVSVRPNDTVSVAFYDSAIIARGWRDPSPKETEQIFRTMVESIGSGRAQITEALALAQGSIDKLLQGK